MPWVQGADKEWGKPRPRKRKWRNLELKGELTLQKPKRKVVLAAVVSLQHRWLPKTTRPAAPDKGPQRQQDGDREQSGVPAGALEAGVNTPNMHWGAGRGSGCSHPSAMGTLEIINCS